MRLERHGSPYSCFNPLFDGAVSGLAVQPDGKIIIAGGFANTFGRFRLRVFRLFSDGSFDSSLASTFQKPSNVSYSRTSARTLESQLFYLEASGGYFRTWNFR